jgi:phage-related protein
MTWVVEYLTDEVEAELKALPKDMQAKFLRIVQMIETSGLERVHEPYVKHIQGKLWEMRMIGRDGISRALYVTATGRRVVVVRVFVKKTQKTPSKEIRLALKRAETLNG